MKLQALAERLQCRLEGDGEVEIVRVGPIERARPGDLSFIANPKYLSKLAGTRASAVIVGEALPGRRGAEPTCALLRSDDPYTAFARAVQLFVHACPPAPGIDRLSSVAADAAIADDVSIGPFVVVGAGASIGARTIVYPNVVIGHGVSIGDDCVVHSHVAIRERVRIGDRVILHNGAVIGSDGFGYATQPDGTHLKVLQQADVVIEDDVEIGANSTIDRPAVGETRIGKGAKIDNLVQIAHGVSIGERVLLASQVGIAGSTAVEDDVMMGGQAGVAGHLRVGRRAVIAGRTVVTKSVGPGEFVTGYPGIPNREWRKAAVIFRRLPALKKRLEELEQIVAGLARKPPRPKVNRRGRS